MSHAHYYIDIDGRKDGPVDLVTLMRRIRAQKITPDTRLYINDTPETVRAGDVPEISLFFAHGEPKAPDTEPEIPSLFSRLHKGWQFTIEHNVMTVYAGGLLLLSLLLALRLVGNWSFTFGGLLAWCIFITFHNVYLIFSLRLHRGQTLSRDFIDRKLTPMLPSLIIASSGLALMMAGGLILLVIPGLIVAVLYAFVPFLILDHRYDLVEAMHASRLLLQKQRGKYSASVALLIVMHLACVLLIVPIPLSLPVFSAALADIYEEVSAL